MNAATASTRSKKIRALNDLFRSTFTGGVVTLTAGVDALPAEAKAKVLEAVRTFCDFDEGNDPHAEHDLGAIEIEGTRCFFKIDYYDKEVKFGSEDPSDPAQTARVMTIMLAEEY